MKLPPLVSLTMAALLLRVSRFAARVVRRFLDNQGILMAGGIGYNVLLSIIPLLGLLAVLLTQLVEERRLLFVMSMQARHVAPAHSDLIIDAVRAFLEARELIGVFGLLFLLFFSSFAFRMLESAIGVIFHQPHRHFRIHRNFWVSVALPYAFILVTGAGLLALTLLFTLMSTLTEQITLWLRIDLPLSQAPDHIINLFSFFGLFILFTAIYKVMPVVKIAWRRALIGGAVAAILWELVRLMLVYYFMNISFVSVIYGSAATLIIILLSLEIAAIILLLGAQVIAELERSDQAGLAWYQEPKDD